MLENIIKKFKEGKVLVIGDLILDEYVTGEAEKLSPEAPVPVIKLKERYYKLGGAANTANNISSLSKGVYLCGFYGDDEDGTKLINLISENNIKNIGLKYSSYQTIVKTRITARYPYHPPQQIVRVDKEKTVDIPKKLQEKVINNIKEIIDNIDVIAISDYDKGFLTENIIRNVREISKTNKKITIVDTKPSRMHLYKDFDWFTPNIIEAQTFSNIKHNGIKKNLKEISKTMIKKLNPNYFLITCGGEGMYFYDKALKHIPVITKEVSDVSGAGDTVVAILALALASGAKPLEAVQLANYGASIVVGKAGTATINIDELEYAIKNNN